LHDNPKADGSSQVKLHLAKLSKDLSGSLLPTPPQLATKLAAVAKPVNTPAKTATQKVANDLLFGKSL
tara:strand:- start:6777 stop:6980 length:204 start_codon:yes stop_codon:yes gene_type:complete